MVKAVKSNAKKSSRVWVAILIIILVGLAVWAIVTVTQPNTDYRDMDTYVGLTETEAIETAEEGDLEYRIVERNGEAFPVTDDLNYDRVNFTVEDGEVVGAEIY